MRVTSNCASCSKMSLPALQHTSSHSSCVHRNARINPLVARRHLHYGRATSAPGQTSRRVAASALPAAAAAAPAVGLVANALLEVSEGSGLAAAALPLAVAALPVAGVLGFKFYCYSQMEYITASMISRYVPRQAKTVLQLGGTTRDLYYYPKETLQVTVVGEDVNVGLFDQAGVSAQMPTLVKKQSISNLAFQPDGTIDAIVCLRSLASVAKDPTAVSRFLNEAARVLRPGAPLIFVEPVQEGGSPLRGIITSGGQPIDTALLEGLKNRSSFEGVQWDIALEGQDPHAVGIAVRSSQSEAGVRGNGPGKAKKAGSAAPRDGSNAGQKAEEAPKGFRKRA